MASNKTTVETILAEEMPKCSSDNLEEKVLSIICPLLDQMITEIFDEAEKILDHEEPTANFETSMFDNNLFQCQNVLIYWKKIFQHVEKHKPLRLKSIKSLLNYLPKVIIKTCSLCKVKMKKYSNGILASTFHEIYRESCLIVKLYCNFIINSVEFDTKEDLESIKHVIADIGKIASLTIYGLGTMTLTWKIFVKLACDPDLKVFKNKEISIVILEYFKFIGNDIIWILNNISKPNESDNSNRIKSMNMLLDSLDRLHKNYLVQMETSNIQFFEDMADFIIHLTGYYILNSKVKPSSGAEKKIFTQDWPSQLQSYYCDYEIFEEVLINKRKNETGDSDISNYYAIGFHFSVLDRKIKNEENIPKKMEAVISNLNNIQEEILLRRIKIPIHVNENEDEVNIYDYTLMHLCEYCHDVSTFAKIELILLKYLLCEQFWPGLLCFDILRYCYSISTDDLLLTHINYFMTTYEKFKERIMDSYGITLLSKLIIEIFITLSEEQKNELIMNCQCEEILSLLLKSPKVSDADKNTMLNMYKQIMSIKPVDTNLTRVFTDLQEYPSVNTWTRLTTCLKLLGMEKKYNKDECTQVLIKIWMLAVSTLQEINDDFRCRMLHELISLLLECTVVKEFSNSISFNWPLFKAIAEKIIERINLPDEFTVQLCHHLKIHTKVIRISTGNDDGKIIGDLVCHMLANNSSLIFQEVLETFDFIIENSEDNNLIMEMGTALKRNPKLLKTVPEYLRKKNPYKLLKFSNINDYLRVFVKYCPVFASRHKCYKNEKRERDKKMPKLDSDYYNEKAERLSTELLELAEEKHTLDTMIVEKVIKSCQHFIDKQVNPEN